MSIPILVEANVNALKAEIALLRTAEGPHSETFANGAIAALEWLMKGGIRPSDTLMFISSRHG